MIIIIMIKIMMIIVMIAKAAVGLKLLKFYGLLFPLARVIKAFLLVMVVGHKELQQY